MQSKFLIAAICFFYFNLLLSAEVLEGSCGKGVFYKYDKINNELIIYGKGEMYNYSYYSSSQEPPWYSDGLTKILIEEGVTSIGSFAFEASKIKEIELPNTLNKIGTNAFQGCDSLTTIVIPESVKEIGDNAFSYCENLSSITLNSPIDMGKRVFNNCPLKNIFVKCKDPSLIKTYINYDIFDENEYRHACLYVPTNSWRNYAYSEGSFSNFYHICEFSYEISDITNSQIYALLSVSDERYLSYDDVNDSIFTISSLNELNKNSAWVYKEYFGKKYIYNVAASKFLTKSLNKFKLVDEVVDVDINEGQQTIDIENHSFYFIPNSQINANSNFAEVTSVEKRRYNAHGGETIFTLNGIYTKEKRKGFHIVKKANGKTVKVIK